MKAKVLRPIKVIMGSWLPDFTPVMVLLAPHCNC